MTAARLLLLASLLVSCREGQTPADLSSLPVERLFHQRGCEAARYEYYGWHYALHCGVGSPPGEQLAQPFFLGASAGCNIYNFEYYGYHPYVRCDSYREPDAGALTQPVQELAHIAGWKILRFEYYGWHAFAVHDGGPNALGRLTDPPELIFSQHGCQAYRFEYYGWHTFMLCDGRTPVLAEQRSKLTQPIETVSRRGPCSHHRFEYYGWHSFARCDGMLSAEVTSLHSCGQNCVYEQGVPTIYY